MLANIASVAACRAARWNKHSRRDGPTPPDDDLTRIETITHGPLTGEPA